MSKLLNITCKNCGAEYRISSRGEMNCRYCGSKVYLSDKDFNEYLRTRDEMLIKDRFNNDLINTDGDILGIYKHGNEHTFDFIEYTVTRPISLIYTKDHCEMSIGSNTIAIVFDNADDFYNYLKNIKLSFPSADIKQLGKYIPAIVFEGKLRTGEYAILLDKDENVYPLELFDIGLSSKSVAWIISRLENLGCLLEFNGLDMKNLSLADIFINPKTHEVYLLGNWENIIKSGKNQFLYGIRKSIKEIKMDDTPNQMYLDFINGTPATNAYEDFAKWDEVINKGFGGHNFHKFEYLP